MSAWMFLYEYPFMYLYVSVHVCNYVCEFHYSNILFHCKSTILAVCHHTWTPGLHHWNDYMIVNRSLHVHGCGFCVVLECMLIEFHFSRPGPGQSKHLNLLLPVSWQMLPSMNGTVNSDTRLFCFRHFHLIKHWRKPKGHRYAVFQEVWRHAWQWCNTQNQDLQVKLEFCNMGRGLLITQL